MNEQISALQDFREIATLPVTAALAALAITWVIWYFTGNRCTEELAALTGCNASALAKFVHPALLKDILTNSAIAATGGGVWSYVMITRERRAREAAEKDREAAEKAREAAEKALAESRQREEEAIERADEERRRADEVQARLQAEIERLTRHIEGQQGGTAC